MGKWADYCIVAVRFSPGRKYIETVRVLPDTGDLLETGLIMARAQIIAGVQRGMTFYTAVQEPEGQSYSKGQPVRVVTVAAVDYLRTDMNRIAADDLGDLPDY
jgi:hypothetical protein